MRGGRHKAQPRRGWGYADNLALMRRLTLSPAFRLAIMFPMGLGMEGSGVGQGERGLNAGL